MRAFVLWLISVLINCLLMEALAIMCIIYIEVIKNEPIGSFGELKCGQFEQGERRYY